MKAKRTTVLAGLSSSNATLFHRIRFLAPDASVILDFADGETFAPTVLYWFVWKAAHPDTGLYGE